MAFDSSTLSIGDPTRKSDYDRLMDNTVHILKETATFLNEKTFNADIFSLGNMGLGTISPTFDVITRGLHIAGTGNTGIRIQSTTGGSGDWEIYASVASDGSLRFREGQNNAVMMLIHEGGNVAIGTAATSVEATAGHFLQLKGVGAASDAFLSFTNADTGHTVNDGFAIGINSAELAYINQREAFALTLSTSALERMRIASGGNVAIGTDAALVDATAGYVLQLKENTSAHVYLQFSNNDTGHADDNGLLMGIQANESALIINQSDNYIAFTTLTTERMRILSNTDGGHLRLASSTGLKFDNEDPVRIHKMHYTGWNADDPPGTKSVAHGVTLANIVHLTATVLNNAGTEMYSVAGDDVGHVKADGTYVILSRKLGGLIDNGSWNAATGDIFIWYTI